MATPPSVESSENRFPPLSELLKTPHPPSPWKLRARLFLSLFWIPQARVQLQVDPRIRVMSFFGYACVGAAWVDYGPRGSDCVLAYRELLIAQLVREGGWPKVHISRIWVDSAESVAGGQNLWGIPKDFAAFELKEFDQRLSWSARGRDGFLAQTDFPRKGLRLPFPIAAKMELIQKTLPGEWRVTPNRMRGTVQFCSSPRWVFGDSAGLSALFSGARPWCSLSFVPVSIQFGR